MMPSVCDSNSLIIGDLLGRIENERPEVADQAYDYIDHWLDNPEDVGEFYENWECASWGISSDQIVEYLEQLLDTGRAEDIYSSKNTSSVKKYIKAADGSMISFAKKPKQTFRPVTAAAKIMYQGPLDYVTLENKTMIRDCIIYDCDQALVDANEFIQSIGGTVVDKEVYTTKPDVTDDSYFGLSGRPAYLPVPETMPDFDSYAYMVHVTFTMPVDTPEAERRQSQFDEQAKELDAAAKARFRELGYNILVYVDAKRSIYREPRPEFYLCIYLSKRLPRPSSSPTLRTRATKQLKSALASAIDAQDYDEMLSILHGETDATGRDYIEEVMDIAESYLESHYKMWSQPSVQAERGMDELFYTDDDERVGELDYESEMWSVAEFLLDNNFNVKKTGRAIADWMVESAG